RQVLKKLPTKKLILLFDEYELFENKIDAGLLSPDVLNMLANLIENHPVFMVFTGSQYLEQRRRDYWRLLARSHHKMISYLARAPGRAAGRRARPRLERRSDEAPAASPIPARSRGAARRDHAREALQERIPAAQGQRERPRVRLPHGSLAPVDPPPTRGVAGH